MTALASDRPTVEAERPGADPAVLAVTDLCVDFGVDRDWVPAVRNVSLHVDRGETLAVVGESGSGKSTTAMTVLDLLPGNARVHGSLRFKGRELRTLRPAAMRQVRGRQIAAIFQEPMTALNPVLTVGYQICEVLRLHRHLTPRAARGRAIGLLELVGLPDPVKAFNSYPHQLSGGQRQRVMIAQAVSCDPELLIADEPTTALDVTVQAEILQMLRDLRTEFGSAILLITHDMGVVADLADRIVVMKDGAVVEQGAARAIFGAPEQDYTRQLLAAVPRIEAVEEAVADSAGGVGPTTQPTMIAHPSAAGSAGDVPPSVARLDQIVVEFGRHGKLATFRALDRVSLELRAGEVLGLVGEYGSGKSTLGRVIVGLQPIVGGAATVGGIDLTRRDRANLTALHRKVGIVFQDPSSSLNPRMPIGESIAEPILMAGAGSGRALQHRVEELLDEVSLPRHYRNRFPHELSGGQKQRVGIARALALRPELLVADEPTSALDVSVQTVVLDLLRQLREELSFACLFISHDLAVVDEMADRIAVMHRGVIVEQGGRDAVLRAPARDYTRRLIDSVPFPDPDIQRERRERLAQQATEGLGAGPPVPGQPTSGDPAASTANTTGSDEQS